MSSTKKSIILQTTYNIFILIVPFITAPYISRMLGSENVGIYSYHYSIINYFMIFELLGLDSYGNRTIARLRDDRNKVNTAFSEIFISHLIVSMIVICLYVGYLFTQSGLNKIIGVIQFLYLIGQMFNISWLFSGLAEFKITVFRNLIIKVIMISAIFIFVKTKNDLLIYIFILSADMFLSQISLWIVRKKYVSFVKVKRENIVKHFKPMLVLFVAIIASSIYRMMDKTMLGNMGFLKELGCYEYADKIIRIPLSVITGVGTVMLSNAANLFGKGEGSQAIAITKNMLRYITLFDSLMIFGVLSYGTMFSTLYLGKEYEFTGTLLAYLAITLLFISWNDVLRTQFYIPQARDKVYVIATCCGALINIIFNILLIPKYSSIGVSIATVISYLGVFSIQLFIARKELKSARLLCVNLPYVIIGVIPFLLSHIWKNIFPYNWIGFILQVLIFSVEFILIVIIWTSLNGELLPLKKMLIRRRK